MDRFQMKDARQGFLARMFHGWLQDPNNKRTNSTIQISNNLFFMQANNASKFFFFMKKVAIKQEQHQLVKRMNLDREESACD